jgi:acyl carrier protein
VEQSLLEAILPLSGLQEGVLFHALYDGGGVDPYIVQVTFDVQGGLDAGRLRAACQGVLDRHPNLRAAFVQRGNGQPVQLIPRAVTVPWAFHDLSGVAAGAQPGRVRELLAGVRADRFDMAAPPLIRFTLVKLGPARHLLAITDHHILLDGWSLSLLLRDLFTIYADGDDRGLPPVTPYRDYLAWVAGQDLAAARAAWGDALAGLERPALVAPGAGVAAVLPRTAGLDLAPEVTAALSRMARAHHLTVNTVIQAAWALLVHNLTGAGDVSFGTVVSGRPPDLPGVEDIVGLLINTIPVRVRLNPAEPLITLMTRIQHQQSALTPYHHLPLTDITRQTPHHTLFDTVTVYENYPMGSAQSDAETIGLRLAVAEGTDTYHYPLKLMAAPGEQLRLELSYRADLFTEAAAQLILGDLASALTSIAHDPRQATSAAAAACAGSRAVQLAALGEESLRSLFAEVIGTDQVADDDHFFALGGDSLRALRLTGRINAEFGVHMDIREVFDHPTPAGLARRLSGRIHAERIGASNQEGSME